MWIIQILFTQWYRARNVNRVLKYSKWAYIVWVSCIAGFMSHSNTLLSLILQAHTNPSSNWSARMLRKLRIPNIMSNTVPNKPLDFFTCSFKRSKIKKYVKNSSILTQGQPMFDSKHSKGDNFVQMVTHGTCTWNLSKRGRTREMQASTKNNLSPLIWCT